MTPFDFTTLTEEQKLWLIEAIGGCTFEDCDTGDDVWMMVAGRIGTPAEGSFACLCETHAKAMVTAGATQEGAHNYVARIRYVHIVATEIDLN